MCVFLFKSEERCSQKKKKKENGDVWIFSHKQQKPLGVSMESSVFVKWCLGKMRQQCWDRWMAGGQRRVGADVMETG